MASGVIALLKQPKRKTAASAGDWLAELLVAAFACRLCACAESDWIARHQHARETVNFTWFQVGATNVDLGWVLDPLSAVMLVMVSFVGLLIFIYSIGYMEHDENYTRFFCFLSLFAGAMLGVVIANSLLLLFMCWEIGGTYFVFVDRLLVSEARGGGGGEESLPHHARRRCLLSARNGLAFCADRHAALL